MALEKEMIDENSDSLSLYLKEISNVPLLDEEEEKELFIRINNGDKKAREIVINSNLRLVVNIARHYLGRGLSFEDLIQEGNLGLMHSIDKFDATKGYRLSTYATFWIKQNIIRAIYNKGKSIRVPIYLYRKISLYNKALNKLHSELKREPTEEEILKETNLKRSDLEEILKAKIEPVSINAAIGEDDTTLEEFLPASIKLPEEEVIDKIIPIEIQKLFAECNLSKMEQKVVLLRYGFKGDAMTLEKISEICHLTRERIRQIEQHAIFKMRHYKNIREYISLIDLSSDTLKNNHNREYLMAQPIHRKTEKQEKELKRVTANIEKKTKTLYEYFSDYTKEQVDRMISMLPEEDKRILKLRYGDNFTIPKEYVLDDRLKSKYQSVIVPRMKKILVNIYNTDKFITTNPAINALEDNDIPCELTKEEYTTIRQLIITKAYNNISEFLSIKELIIISLKFGYFDNKCFTDSQIAKFLGIDEIVVKETVKNILLFYKNKIEMSSQDANEHGNVKNYHFDIKII